MKKPKCETSKERILEAAVKLFSKNGYDRTSIREICKDAGANICMISYFWGGKKELYRGIIEDLIEKQTEFSKSFIDFEKKPEDLSKKEQISLLYTIIEKMIDFSYSGYVSNDLFRLLLLEQQEKRIEVESPTLSYLRELIATIFGEKKENREMIFKTLFIISQVNSPKFLPRFSLGLLKQKTFQKKDVEIISKNVKLYINMLLKEAGIV